MTALLRSCESAMLDKPQTHRIVAISAIWLCCLLGHNHCFANDSNSDVSRLIDQLDAEKFESREFATTELIMIGEPALQPLAFHFYSATPEAAWRIKRVLQKIGTQSAEEVTSLKAIGILMLLDHQLDTELTGLINQWRENRSQRAIDFLTSKGASVVSGNNRSVVLPGQNLGQIRIYSGSQLPNPLRKRTVKPKLEQSEAKSKIKEVVSGDLDAIQKLIFANLPDTNQQDQLVDDFFVGQAGLRGFGRASNSKSTFIEIGDGWMGSSNDLKRLNEIHSLFALRFTDQDLKKKQVDILEELKELQHIGFLNTSIDGRHISEVELPDGIKSVELADQVIDASTIKWLRSRPLTNLTLEKCNIPTAIQPQLGTLNSLEYLKLKRLTLSRELFEQLVQMTNLQTISLSVCKFDIRDYQEFAMVRPRVIRFEPVSFLGVQGAPSSLRPGSLSCKIESVVANSGAEAAGVMEGDVIQAVNGVAIKTFDELRMHISQLDIGEKMTLSVLRDNEELELSAKLGVNNNSR